ncbi:MAG: hypothetical protein HS116_27965 [Planctomycetes bacterium]|nr:hypothetical protein [Planctomycetota bacterium]
MSARPHPFLHAGFAGRIGVARRDITAPVGIYARNWGAAAHDACEGVHRPLTATVLVLQNASGGETLALVSIDLIHGGDPENVLVRAVRDELKLDPARVMLAFTHTHACPRWETSREDLPGMSLVPAYGARLVQELREAGREALARAEPAVLTWRYGRCALAAVRDLPDPDTERLVTGFHPGASADDTLLAGRVTNASGRVMATLVHYACHPTTFAWQNKLLSPDWPGAMREVVEGATDGAPCLFLQGASGELAPREQYTGDPSIVDKNGRQAGYAALAALEDMLPPATRLEYAGVVESGAPLATWRRAAYAPSTVLRADRFEVELALKDDLPGLVELQARQESERDRALRERLRRKIALRERLGEGRTHRVPVWLWRVGDAVLLGQINETYSDFQRSLRAAAPGVALAPMNVVNGSMGYLPPRELYTRDVYPVWQTPYAAGSLEKLTAACAERVHAILKD